jgi:SAM-dependent methyltransferase
MKPQGLDGSYHRHSKTCDPTHPEFRTNRKEAVDLLALQEGERVIDWGCGSGLNFPYLLRKKANLVGVECSTSLLRKARKKFPGVELVQGDMATQAFPQQADKAICTYSLSMVHSWEQAVSNMSKALKPDGRLVILDFGRPGWPLKPVSPLFNGWLKLRGVNPGRPFFSLLPKYFRDVKIRSLRLGYILLALAEFPLPQPFLISPPTRPFRVVSQKIISHAEGQPPILSFDFSPNT